MLPTPAPALHDFVTDDELNALIHAARREDLGPDAVDATSRLFIPADLTATAVIRPRKPGQLAGVALLPRIVHTYDPAVTVTLRRTDGDAASPGDAVATFAGPLRSILTLERVALNFCTHLSGIATLTARYVEQCAGTKARIYDTRKTIPGLRGLAKYAVRCGGGFNHRIGLYDAVLIKDNHLAHIPLDNLQAQVTEAAQCARSTFPDLKFVEVEVDNLRQLEHVLRAPIDLVLLDNMGVEALQQAVALRDRLAPSIELEASGNVNLDTVAALAKTGVDRIAVGALTHSAAALDLGLDIQ